MIPIAKMNLAVHGLEGDKKVSNGNYLWTAYFHLYLGPKGRAGFVMSSQTSSAVNSEAEVRFRSWRGGVE